MADTTDDTYLSIGEVLGLLLEEFPDVTISKIRFLESQGLISPERTASGYRKFYGDDVDLLRVILTEQRQNFLPLRVIKDRLETGEIDPTGEHLRPNEPPAADDPPAAATPAAVADGADDLDPEDEHDQDHDSSEVPSASVAAHPASRGHAPPPDDPGDEQPEPSATPDAAPAADAEPDAGEQVAPKLLPGVVLDRSELCSMVGMTDRELEELESFGVIQARDSGSGIKVYGDDAVEIAKPACAFLRAGIDARHLRNFRTAAEREASLYEQLVAPRFRQRNPEAQSEALAQLQQLDQLGGKLRAAMTRHALSHHYRS